MKKILKLLLAASLSFSCVACSSSEPTKENEQETIKTEKGLFNVTITLPKDYVDEETTQETLDKVVEQEGYVSATLNEDGTVSYVMSKNKQKEMLQEYKENVKSSLSEYIGGEDTPNLTDIKYNDNLTQFTVYTKNEVPDLTESFLPISMFIYGQYYNLLAGNEVDDILVDFMNTDSKENIGSTSLKEWKESLDEYSEENQ